MHDILVWRFKLFPADNSFFAMNNRITNHSMSSKKSSLRARSDFPKYWGIISSHEWEKLSSLQIVSKDEKLLKFAVIYVSWISRTSPLRVYVAIFFFFSFFHIQKSKLLQSGRGGGGVGTQGKFGYRCAPFKTKIHYFAKPCIRQKTSFGDPDSYRFRV